MTYKKAPQGIVGQTFLCKSSYTPTLGDFVSMSGLADWEVELAVANRPVGEVVAINKNVTPVQVTVEVFGAKIVDLVASGAVTAGNHIKPATGGKGSAAALATLADVVQAYAIALTSATDGNKFTALPVK